MPTRNLPEPTPENLNNALRVQLAVCNELNLLAREGVGVQELLAGTGTVICDLITCTAGPEHVARWFERQAELVRELQGGGH